MTHASSLPVPAATPPVAADARPGRGRASRPRRGPWLASLALHGLVFVLGTVAFRRPPRAGPPHSAGFIALDLPRSLPFSVDDPTDLDGRPASVPDVLDDVEFAPPDAPTLPPVPDLAVAPPDDAMPPPEVAAPALEPTVDPVAESDLPPSPAPRPVPHDSTRRTRRESPAAPPNPPARTPVVAHAAPAPGARPPLVAIASPTPPLVPGGAPGSTLVVVLEYTIGPDGTVTDAVVRGSSGSAPLDASTRAFVLAHWRYAPPGESRRVARRFVFTYGGGAGGG